MTERRRPLATSTRTPLPGQGSRGRAGGSSSRACACLLALSITACADPGPPGEQEPGAADTPTADVSAELREAIREAEGRAIVHFEPAEGRDESAGQQDVRADTARLRTFAEDLCCDVLREIHRVYWIVPAVSATVDPDRLGELLADPRVRYVEPDRRYRLPRDTASRSPDG